MDRIADPLGHGYPRSKFERLWEMIPLGYGITRQRVERFDGTNLVAFSPVEYVLHPIETPKYEVDPTTILSTFESFVRDEISETERNLFERYPSRPRIVDKETALLSDIGEYIAEAERSFVYGQFMKELRARSPKQQRLGNFIYNVISNEHIGHEANRKFVDRHAFVQKVEADERDLKRLLFVFLGLPFKDQNPLRTDAPASHVDLAEIGLLAQLHIQALAFHQDHPFGTDFVILSDGKLYARIFDVEWSAAEQYVSRVREVRNRLNLQGSVHIIDLEECILKLPSSEREQFDATRQSVKRLLSTESGTRPEIATAFRNLKRGMRRNINTRDILKDLGWRDKIELIHGEALGIETRHRGIARDLEERCTNAALEYAATNVALRVHNIVGCFFRDAIRATVHPKQKQVAIPRSGSAYPWNGIGVWARAKPFPKAIECREFGELGRLGAEWIAGYFPGEHSPAYYRLAI